MATIAARFGPSSADRRSLTEALAGARAGDVVLVGPGVYSPARTRETVPLRVPPGVSVVGADHTTCVIDGDGLFEPSFDPIQLESAVVILGEGARLSGVTVRNGGGHGVVIPPGVTAEVHDSAISGHGQHGLYLCGVAEALVTGCRFFDNGLKRFEPAVHGAKARQGHHVFATAQEGQRNRVIVVDNTMQACFADGIAVVCLPAPDEVTLSTTILRNTIERSERSGLLFSASFGSTRNRHRIVAADNVLRDNAQFGIGIIGAIPLAQPRPRENELSAVVAGNTISGSTMGIFVRGAVGDAQRNHCDVTVDRNDVSGYSAHAIRLVAGLGTEGVTTSDNTIDAALSRNTLSGGIPAVLVESASGAGDVRNNRVVVQLLDNRTDVPSEAAIVVGKGADGNDVHVTPGSQGCGRMT
jgi:hypothetical protein